MFGSPRQRWQSETRYKRTVGFSLQLSMHDFSMLLPLDVVIRPCMSVVYWVLMASHRWKFSSRKSDVDSRTNLRGSLFLQYYRVFSFFRNGGQGSWMNDRKESVVDLATKQNCPELYQALASHQGQLLIDRQVKIYEDHQNRYYDKHARTGTADGHRSS